MAPPDANDSDWTAKPWVWAEAALARTRARGLRLPRRKRLPPKPPAEAMTSPTAPSQLRKASSPIRAAVQSGKGPFRPAS